MLKVKLSVAFLLVDETVFIKTCEKCLQMEIMDNPLNIQTYQNSPLYFY